MQSNAMKSCAVGAMLFGGTLGASAAQAGVTFSAVSIPVNDAVANYAFSSDTFFTDDVYFASFSISAQGYTTTNGSMVSWAATTDDVGFSVGATARTGSGYWRVETFRAFTVTESAIIQLDWTSNAGWELRSGVIYGQGGVIEETFALSGSSTINLSAGTYHVWSTLSGTTSAGSFSFQVVPAPGALALLGAAGLVGNRRRRN